MPIRSTFHGSCSNKEKALQLRGFKRSNCNEDAPRWELGTTTAPSTCFRTQHRKTDIPAVTVLYKPPEVVVFDAGKQINSELTWHSSVVASQRCDTYSSFGFSMICDGVLDRYKRSVPQPTPATSLFCSRSIPKTWVYAQSGNDRIEMHKHPL